MLFNSFAESADVVGADECVIPCECGGVAGVIDESGDWWSVVCGDAGNEHGGVRESLRVESADSMSPEWIEKVAVSGEAAGTGADDGGGRLSAGGGFDGQPAHFLSHVLEVGCDQVTAGEFAAAECHPATAMCVSESDEDAGGVESGGGGHIRGKILLEAGFKDAVIERENDAGSGVRAIDGFQPQQAGCEWPMDSGGLIVQCGAPHAVVDTDRGSDIAATGCGSAAKLGKLNGGHVGDSGGGSGNSGARGLSRAQQTASMAMIPQKNRIIRFQLLNRSASHPADQGNSMAPKLPTIFIMLNTVAVCRPPNSMATV